MPLLLPDGPSPTRDSMKRIIYVPWPENECPVTATDVKGWANTYKTRTHQVSKFFKELAKDQKPAFKPAQVELEVGDQKIKAAEQTFEVIFWDYVNKNQLQDLHKVEGDDEKQLHQL